jgi:hypothetical protein
MPFDLYEITDEFRRNPKPYLGLLLLAVVVLVGGLVYRKTGGETDRASLAKIEARLKADGLLLLSDEHRDARSCGCPTNSGFLVAWIQRDALSFASYRQPWDGPQPFAIDIPPHVLDMATDPSRRRIAMAAANPGAAGGVVRVWDVSSGKWNILRDIPDRGLPLKVAISADGTRIVHESREEVVVTNVADGKRLYACPAQRGESIAIHPAGAWIALSGNPLVLISINGTPQARKKFVDGLLVYSREDRETLIREGETEQSLDDEPPMGKESVTSVGFSRDGKWLWCGTTNGLRVYDWTTVTGTTGTDMPAARFRFTPPDEPPIKLTPYGDIDVPKFIRAIVEEPDAKGILFGGSNSRLYRLDLSTGATRELIRLPGETTSVEQLAISPDGKTLGVAVHTVFLSPYFRNAGQRWAWQIWSYPGLRALPAGSN